MLMMRYYVFLTSIHVYVHPSTVIAVQEVQIPFNMSIPLNLCFLCNLRLPSRRSSIRRKHVTLHIQLFFSMIAVFIRTELLCSSIRLFVIFPPNRANGVVVFDGSPIRYNNTPFENTFLRRAAHVMVL